MTRRLDRRLQRSIGAARAHSSPSRRAASRDAARAAAPPATTSRPARTAGTPPPAPPAGRPGIRACPTGHGPGRRPRPGVPAGGTRDQPEPGFERLAQRVQVTQQRQVQRDGGDAGLPDQPDRYVRSTTVHDHRDARRRPRGCARDDRASEAPPARRVAEAALRRYLGGQRAGSDGSSTWTRTDARGRRAATSADVPAQRLGERRDEVADGTVVAQQPAAGRQFERRGERVRAGDLHLDHTGVVGGLLGDLVEVARQQVTGPRRSWPGREAARHRLAYSSTGSSTSSAADRPITSAPGPRAGSSGRWGRSGSSPRTTRRASAISVPGSDPIPVAAPAGQGQSVTTATYPQASVGYPTSPAFSASAVVDPRAPN